MEETFQRNELYNYAQDNFKKLLEVAFSGDVNSKQPLDDPHILQKIQDISIAMNDPISECYIEPQLLRDCSEGNYELVKKHISECCDLNEVGPDGETALACAIHANNIHLVELLLKSGANPNSRQDKIESTPLMEAGNIGNTEIFNMLLKFGANPDIKSSTNNTALHYAASGGHIECCKLIINYSRNPLLLIEEQNENGHTALMEAATNGFFDIVRFLVEIGARINISSAEFKETALTLASYKGYSDIVQYLLEAGADLDHRTDEMHTALMEASMEGHIEAAKILLYYGARVSMRSDSFESPLTLAACSGHTDLAAYLITYGADIEEVNDESYTPLMEASREGHFEAVAMLLALGAVINRITEETQETAMTLAACGGFFDIVLMLHRCGADIELGASTPLMESAQEGHLEIVKALIIMGANVDAKNSSHETSLHFAAENGHVEVCRYLLDHNADINLVSEGGRTCLMKACQAGNLDVVYLLIDRGALVDQMTTNGDHNALSLACANGHCPIVEYLLQVGADPTVKLKDNCSVLIEASRAGHIDVIEILLQDTKRENRLLISNTNNYRPHIYPLDGLDNEFTSMQRLNQHFMSTTTTTTSSFADLYDMNHIFNIPDAIQMQQPSLSMALYDCSPLPNIYANQNLIPLENQSLRNISPLFNTCSFSSSASNDSCELQLVTGVTTDNLSLVRPLFNTADVKDPSYNSTQIMSLPNQDPSYNSLNPVSLYSTLSSNATLPMSIFGTENDKILHNIFESNSPNLEEWVKYIYPNLNPVLYDPEPKLSQTESDSFVFDQPPQHATTSSHVQRKIKKAKHSENYNSQLDLMFNKNLIQNYQNRLEDNVSAEKTSVEYSENSEVLNSSLYPTESTIDLYIEVKQVDIIEENDVVVKDNNDCDADLSHSSTDSNTIHLTITSSDTTNDTANDAFTNPVMNILSKSTDNSVANNLLTSTTVNTSMDSVDFSLHKNPINTSSMTAKEVSDEQEADINDILNSLLPTSDNQQIQNSINQVSSAPFQKQVLQPKRRLQQNQRSVLPNTSDLPSLSSLCDEQKPKSNSFALPSTSVESSSSVHKGKSSETMFKNDKKSILPNYCPYHKGPLLMCPMTADCLTNPRLWTSSDGQLERIPKIDIDNYDNIPPRRPTLAKKCCTENLDVVDEMDNEEKDNGRYVEADFESDIELGRCTPPYHSNGCCNNRNCKKRLNVNVCTESLQESPLSLACTGGHIEVVKLLVNSGAKLEHRDRKSQTPLHVSVLHGHLEVVRFLLESKADIEAMIDRTKDTALSIACANGKLEIVQELVSKGANIEHRNISDYTPLSLAASGGYVDVIKFMLKNNVEINSRTNSKLGISPLMLAAMNGHLEAVTFLLDNGSDINAQIETNRNTALTLACFQGRTEVVRLLIERKANIEHRAKSGLTPLMEAASQGHIDVGQLLIEAGADVNTPPVPASRETALIIAAEKGHTEFVRLLLEHNAAVDVRNKKGDTPLWLACHGGFFDSVKLLIDAMSDANSADNRRITCLMVAFKKGHVNVAKELVKYATQFPSEHDCSKHMKSIKNEDKDLIKRCEACKDIILKAKQRQEHEAAKNAKDLLKQVEEEKKAKEQKEVKQAKKREKKKAKKKAKHEDKDVEVFKNDDIIIEAKSVCSFPEPEIISSTIYPSKYAEVSTQNNNENINPDIPLSVKSNKRSRTKSDVDKQKNFGSDGIKPVSDTIIDRLKADTIMVTSDNPAILTSKVVSTLASENSCLKNNNSKNAPKNNTWVQISSTKIQSTIKPEDNPVNANWQKIGGNKKKLDIQVNKKDIGKVIGQGGSVVNAIRQITGAHIDIDSVVNEVDERTVHLKGTLDAVTKSRDFICDLVDGNITGNTVIKEAEQYLSKPPIPVSKPLVDYCVTSSNIDNDYSKSTRQNGKVNKFSHIKFGSNSTTVSTGNLQYGFSKSIKGPDFASVAAAGLSGKYVEKTHIVDNAVNVEPMVVTTTSSFVNNNFIKEPLEINTGQHISHNLSSKSFPLAPGSERSLHQRTYNSTPEHSPQIIDVSRHEMQPSSSSTNSTITSSTNSDKDDLVDGKMTPVISNTTPVNVNSWPYTIIDYNNQRSFQEPINEPMVSMADIESINRFPKLHSLNPKAEAFSPSMFANNQLYHFKPEDFYYNANGTLTLNPTANIFKPRQTFPAPSSVSQIAVDPSIKQAMSGSLSYHQTQSPLPSPPQHEERLIRLQDHINMAINILLRTNGFDHNMAEAAFSSFMRSANLDLNTRLTTSEFTSLINNIINQSNNTSVQSSVSLPSGLPSSSSCSSSSSVTSSLLSHINYPMLSSSDPISTGNAINYRQHHQPLLISQMPPVVAQTAQAHWPMLPSLNTQSIWAPAVSGNGAPLLTAGAAINSPFFPSLGQCMSAQAAFNSQPLYNNNNASNNGSSSSSLSQQLSSMLGCDQTQLYQPQNMTENVGQLSSLLMLDNGGCGGVVSSDGTGNCFDQSQV